MIRRDLPPGCRPVQLPHPHPYIAASAKQLRLPIPLSLSIHFLVKIKMTHTAPLLLNLWFNWNAEEAVNFYTSIFASSKIHHINRMEAGVAAMLGRQAGEAWTINFELNGMQLVALNGGPMFTLNEAASLVINCDTQEQVDHYWNHLSEGGPAESQRCGWLKDRYGLSWQVVPTVLYKLMADPDRARAQRAMNAMLGMAKLDIKALEEA